MNNRTKWLFAASCLLAIFAVGTVCASTLVPTQTALPGACIQQFQVPMPVFGPAGIPRVDAYKHPKITVKMKEVNQTVFPRTVPAFANMTSCGDVHSVDLGDTRVWAYEISDTKSGKLLAPANWPAVTVVAQQGVATTVTYENQLPSFNEGTPNGPGLIQGLITIDQTIHWADPLHSPGMNPCMDTVDCTLPANAANPCCQPFTGSPPATVHLHGGEVSSLFDGGPDSWFTPDGKKGPGYATLDDPGDGKAIYYYPNLQEPGTLWFHDHTLGATRTNVYSGLEAFYFLEDGGRVPTNLPDGPYEIEMAIQDRQFDTKGQLFFPDGSGALCGTGLPGDPCLNGGPSNPNINPFWIPEFIGDVAVVNGAPWPVLNVEPRRYRFHLLDGSNARFYRMTFGSVPVYAVGADDNYLDAAVQIPKAFIAPGERLDVIVDFTNFAGQTIDVTNDAATPFPEGLFPVPHPDPLNPSNMLPADQPQMAKIMRFVVAASATGKDDSCDPARGKCRRPVPVVRLTDGKGNLAKGVKIDKVRRLALKEFENPASGAPQFVLVNNTFWDGRRSPSINADFPVNGISELPQQGSTELWEIINLTTDAHPMHTHLVQFQILNRQAYDADGTMGSGVDHGYIGVPALNPANGLPGAWAQAFYNGNTLKCSTFSGDALNPCPGYGPPLDYLTPSADPADPILAQLGMSAVGGNPPIGPYLLGNPTPPAPEESGWKDTAKALPRQVLRLVVRWVPTATQVVPFKTYAGKNLYSFDPTQGDGYVWHCHIIDHEDNEMMRPYKVTK